MSTPELPWFPIEPAPLEREWAQKYEAFRQELLTAFALPPELLGSLDSNVNVSESGIATLKIYHDRFLA